MLIDVYPSYSLVPLDDSPWQLDHDDSVDLRDPVRFTPTRMLAAAAPPVARLVVPFVPLAKGAQGDPVYAIKRAHARYRGHGRLALLAGQPARVQRTFGPYFARELAATQERLGIARTGRYDEATWHGLAPWFDSYALALLHVDVDPRVRKIVGWLQAFYAHRAACRYSQLRPTLLGPAASIDRADCSGMVAAAMRWGSILPKVDWRWTNTDIQIVFGLHVPLAAVKVLDVVFYGRGSNPSHEAIVVSTQPNVTVQTFGHYPVELRDLDYRPDRIEIRRFL